jgi:hypothetical protein
VLHRLPDGRRTASAAEFLQALTEASKPDGPADDHPTTPSPKPVASSIAYSGWTFIAPPPGSWLGSQWDARVIEAFQRCRQKVHAIRQDGFGESLCTAIDGALRSTRPADFLADEALRQAEAD